MTAPETPTTRKSRQRLRKMARNTARAEANAASAAKVLGPEEAMKQSIRQTRKARDEAEHRRAARLSGALSEPPPDQTVLIYLEGAEKQRQLAKEIEGRVYRWERDGRSRIHSPDATKAYRILKGYSEAARVLERLAAEARERQLDDWRRNMDQQEIAAQARARGEPLATVTTEVSEWLRTELGELVQKDGLPVLIVQTARAKKRAGSEARSRLESLGGFDHLQISAAVRFEKEWELSGLEPRVTANLEGSGGGRGSSIADPCLDAKNRVHRAREVLRSAGENVVATVESVVLNGENLQSAGIRVYADHHRHNAQIVTLLRVGLNLLAAHYKFGVKPVEQVMEGVAA